MPEAVKTWQVLELINVTEALFADNEIENPRLNAELLLADTLDIRRFDLYLSFDRPVGENELSAYRNRVKRRLAREPLQYITGKTEFFGLPIEVNPAVLIPRPETELLAEKTLAIAQGLKFSSPRILEIGTGSGCISIAIAHSIECQIDASDISKDALETAKNNSAANSASEKINFILKDILSEPANFDDYDIVVSNPPYIPKDEYNLLEAELKNYEPRSALTDESDGLTFYRKILDIWSLSTSCSALLLEIGDNKSKSVETLLKERKIGNYVFHNDLLRIPRVLILE